MFNISEIVKKTEEMFDLFNEHFYNNELTRPAITVSPDGGRGAYGWCSIHEIWNADNELYQEINLCAEYLDRPITEIAATLLHEMSHLYNLQHDIQDVSNNGYYHNMKFKTTAEAHGLHIEKHPKYGWTVLSFWPFRKKEKFFEKRLAFTPKMRKLSLTRRAANTINIKIRKADNSMKTGR